MDHASRMTPETLTLQCGALRSISLQIMASNVHHAPVTECTKSTKLHWVASIGQVTGYS